MSKKLPDHIDGLVQYLSSPDEKANEDLILKYFRKTFGTEFTRQKEADGSDGYLAGHFVLELKGKTNDWLSGLFQGIAYRKNLDFGVVVVAAKGFLALWSLDDLGENLIDEVLSEKGAPNAIGKRLSQKYKDKRTQFLKKTAYQFPAEYLDGMLQENTSIITKELDSFEKTLQNRKKVRHKVTTKNFTTVLKQMSEFFDTKKPIKVVRAFYSMIFGWNNTSVLEISSKNPEQATLGGEIIENLIAGKREKFKKFVESHYVHLGENENIDDFFAMYDKALDAVDKNFRVKNGIFFTDLDLSRFAMWYARNHIGNIGKNYLVIDPACGSGNLVTNWRSPMELRHKVVSEIEPELLYTVEQRMKGDKWHQGKFTVVPRVTENIGLNFLDKSAEQYIEIVQNYLTAKNQRVDRPIAFLCNPPYRNDDDQSADSIGYKVDQTILDIVGQDASSERVSCFLAQMKRVASIAEDSGLQGETLLLLFTGTSWLTKRPLYEKIRAEIFGNFEDISGFFITSNEFFDVGGKFPIAFTVWKYRGPNSGLDAKRAIKLLDLSKLKKSDLSKIEWGDETSLAASCKNIINSNNASFGLEIPNMRQWYGHSLVDFKRDRRKDEKTKPLVGGLPLNDRRQANKKAYGELDGAFVGFMDDLTPCRIKRDTGHGPWFRLNNQFMDCRKTRCYSGPADKLSHSPEDLASIKKSFIWFSLARVFGSHGYPMWANADEMWPLVPPRNLENKLLKLSFAVGYAENECVQTIFPAGNPVRQANEIIVSNPMTSLEPGSFWNRELAGYFDKTSGDSEDKLVLAVNLIFDIWKKRTKSKKEIYVEYSRPYFIGEGCLKAGAGLIQIRDFAKEAKDDELLSAFETMNLALKTTKDEFNKLLHQKSGFNYFDIDEKKFANLIPKAIPAPVSEEPKKGFEHTVELRLALACKIVEEMNETKEFNRVKFAKAFYLADMVSGVDLKTEYTRDAAGPIDHRSLYNEKIGIESIAAKSGFFSTEKKRGKEFDFVQYSTGSNLNKGSDMFSRLFGKSAEKVNDVIKLTSPMTMNQIEIVATLYACWNDLLISKKKPTDQDLIKEFRDKWHPEKTKKFKSENGKKPRFTEKQLIDAIAWMKAKGLSPQGFGKKTRAKVSRADIIPF